MSQPVGQILAPDNGKFVAACVICKEQGPVMLYPHKLDGLIVGWVFVCPKDESIVQDADLHIQPRQKPIRLHPNPQA